MIFGKKTVRKTDFGLPNCFIFVLYSVFHIIEIIIYACRRIGIDLFEARGGYSHLSFEAVNKITRI